MSKHIENENPSTAIKNELSKVEHLKSLLENQDALYDEDGNIDAALLLDTIEGETNLNEMLLEIDEYIAENESKAEAIKIRVEALNKRKARILNTNETFRAIILSAMDKAGIKKIEGALATLSVKNKPPALVVHDEAQIPSKYFENVPKLLKKDLTADLKNLADGESIPGVTLDNGGISLMIRRA